MTSNRSRKPVLVAAAIVGALGIFGGGTALGYAINSNDDDASRNGESAALGRLPVGPGSSGNPFLTGAAESASAASSGGGDAATSYMVRDVDSGSAESMAGYDIMPRHAYCSAPIGDVFSGSVLDLATASFEMNLLGDGFELLSMSVRSEGECDENGAAQSGVLVLDTSWRHSATGFEAWVSQRADSEPRANVLYPSSAEFSTGGYQYSVWVSSNDYQLLERGDTVAYPNPEDDPRLQEVRDAVINQLAPDIGSQCFYRQEAGDWDDIASLGVGDPRSALPAGFTESYSSITTFAAPDPSCPGADVEPTANHGFNAGFRSEDGNGWIDVSAWPLFETTGYPGQIDRYSANWSNDDWQFSVYGSQDGEPLGAETVEAIARALDPGFSSQCFITERELSPEELAAVGLNVPVAPEGYSIENSSLRVSELPEGCEVSDPNYAPYHHLHWTIGNGTDVYEVNVSRSPGMKIPADELKASGWISDYGMDWYSAADGTSTAYSIWASNADGDTSRDTMIAIALSLDPGLDITTLNEDGGPRPLPADGGTAPAVEPAPGIASDSGGAAE